MLTKVSSSDDQKGGFLGNSRINMGYDTLGLTVSREVKENKLYCVKRHTDNIEPRRQKDWRQKMLDDY